MQKHIEYQTKGTCSRKIILDIDNGIITNCEFVGGCSGNTQGVASLVTGMKAIDAAKKIKGIKCGFKTTSCPDQLAKAIDQALSE